MYHAENIEGLHTFLDLIIQLPWGLEENLIKSDFGVSLKIMTLEKTK